MKKIWLLIAAIAVISCKEDIPVDYAIISGNISNGAGELSINSLDGSIEKIVLNVDDQGNFADTVRVKPATYILFDGKNRASIYIENGNNMNVSFDANDFNNTLLFTGEGSEVSIYLKEKQKVSSDLMGTGTEVYLLNEKEYKNKMAEIKKELTVLLNASTGVSEDYKIKERRNINYAYLNKLSIYQRYHAHYAKQPEFVVSDEFLAELNGLDYNNLEDFEFSRDYKGLVSANNAKIAKEIAEKEEISQDIAMLKAASNIENETLKNYLLYENSKYNITYTDNLEDFYQTYMTSATNEDQIKEITESYNKLKTVSKGQPSPKFVNYENFDGTATSLDDLKGKYVYVDVWATWCGPCKAEIPSLKKVESDYHGKNIEFVSISVDKPKDHEAWKKMVEEKELKGIQLYADKDWDSDFVKGYLIKGIPRFILIDPDGNIVTANAPRPSQTALIDLFNDLNI